MRWKVEWLTDAEDSLAEIWLSSTDRERVTESADEIQRLWESSPEKYLESLSEGLSFLDYPPLRAYLEVDLAHRMIRVVSLGRPR